MEEFRPADYIHEGAIDLSSVLAIRSDEAYLKQFAGTPLMRAKREGVIRNACCVVANTGALSCLDVLYDCLQNDAAKQVRQYATYALAALYPHANGQQRDFIQGAVKRASMDSDELVRTEAKSQSFHK